MLCKLLIFTASGLKGLHRLSAKYINPTSFVLNFLPAGVIICLLDLVTGCVGVISHSPLTLSELLHVL